MVLPWSRKLRMAIALHLSLYVLAITATVTVFATTISPPIHDGLLNVSLTTCPVAQDGYISVTFPWTHYPTCIDVKLPQHNNNTDSGINHTFCTYTNAHYNNARGISFIVTPEVAASISYEAFDLAIGGLGGSIGESMGFLEVRDAGRKGKGMFARRNITRIPAGENFVVETPLLFVSKLFLETLSMAQREVVLSRAIEQLSERTRLQVQGLAKTRGGSEVSDVVKTNGISVIWPWVDDVPELLAVMPEAARINHACRPNARWRFNDQTLSLEVFATRNIKPGAEITLSHGSETHTYSSRIQSLRETFGFTCHCSLCTANSTVTSASNKRLNEIQALKAVLPTDEADTPQLLGLLPNLIQLLEDEDLDPELPMYEEILAYTWSSFGIEERAKYWAGRARRGWAVFKGKESWESKRCYDLEENVRGHQTWMSWEGDPWEGVGEGHPWDEGEEHDHDHEH